MEIRALREAAGLDLETAAEQMGIGKASLSRIERRLQAPSQAILNRISAWAELKRRSLKLPVSERVDLSWVSETQDKRNSRRRRKAKAA